MQTRNLLRATLPLLALFLSRNAQAISPKKQGEDLQSRIVQFFTANRCDLVRELSTPEIFDSLRPNVLAIVAFCEPLKSDPEKLFLKAEQEDPSGDLILVLHAKYVWRRDPEASKPLWENVLKHARNQFLVSMAKEYLDDNVDEDEPLHLSSMSYQGKMRVGASFETNPILPNQSAPTFAKPQQEMNYAVSGGLQHWTSYGSISANLESSYRNTLQNGDLNFLRNQLDLPISLRLGTYEDLNFRPFTTISLNGFNTYSTQYGFGVMGIAYRPEYKQYVQASIYTEKLLYPSVNAQEGTHYRFDYNWELFPKSLQTQYAVFMEHVVAIHDYSNGTDIKYSHTDIGAKFHTQYFLKEITLEFLLNATYRIDSDFSEYTDKITGLTDRTRRQDFNLELRPSTTIPIFSYVQLQVWYDFFQNFSTLKSNAFANYNMVNQTIGLSLVSEFSNY